MFYNKTGIEFITSDNPVVIHNQILENSDETQKFNGFCQFGVLVFWPISPQYMMVFYDQRSYVIDNHDGNLLPMTLLTKESDVKLLNAFQMMNAFETVYFLGNQGRDQIVEQCRSSKMKALRTQHKKKSVEAKLNRKIKDFLGEYHVIKPLIPLKLNLSVLKIKEDE